MGGKVSAQLIYMKSEGKQVKTSLYFVVWTSIVCNLDNDGTPAGIFILVIQFFLIEKGYKRYDVLPQQHTF